MKNNLKTKLLNLPKKNEEFFRTPVGKVVGAAVGAVWGAIVVIDALLDKMTEDDK